MASAPTYASTPVGAVVQIATANTNRDGTGALGTLHTAGSTGTRIDDIYITATGTTTAGVIRMFMFDGTNNRLIQEILVTAITPSTSVSVWSVTLTNQAIILPNTYALKFSTNAAETFNVVATRASSF